MPNTSHTTWAKRAVRSFLIRCFASAAETLEWDAEALRKAAEALK